MKDEIVDDDDDDESCAATKVEKPENDDDDEDDDIQVNTKTFRESKKSKKGKLKHSKKVKLNFCHFNHAFKDIKHYHLIL